MRLKAPPSICLVFFQPKRVEFVPGALQNAHECSALGQGWGRRTASGASMSCGDTEGLT
jgi:hypothetical protein